MGKTSQCGVANQSKIKLHSVALIQLYVYSPLTTDGRQSTDSGSISFPETKADDSVSVVADCLVRTLFLPRSVRVAATPVMDGGRGVHNISLDVTQGRIQ